MSSQESNPLDKRSSAGVSLPTSEEGNAPYQLEPPELEALRTFILLLDKWDREEGTRDD